MNDQDVHVVFGEVSAGALKQALGRGHRVVIQRDFLSSGPVPHLENWQDWLQVRRQHWHRLTGKEGPFLYDEKVDLYLQIDELRLSSRILLWCGIGLEDQLLKVFLPRFMERFSIDLGELHVLQFDAIAAGYQGPAGFLDHPAPAALTKEEIDELKHAWTVFTDSSPLSLATFVNSNAVICKELPDAMKPLLRRFPNRSTGLDYWEFEVLKACKGSDSVSLAEILLRMLGKVGQELDFIHEIIIKDIIGCMIAPNCGEPLLRTTPETPLTNDSRIWLSEMAEPILHGHASYWPHMKTDNRWVGGTAIASPEKLWCANGDYSDVKLYQGS